MSVDENEAMMSTNNTNEGPDAAPVLDCEESSIHGAATTTTTTTTTPTGPTGLDPNDNDLDLRRGTIPSARFNILSTMVGGGCLSLPLAFQKAGNGLLGPLILLVVAVITDFCFRLLVDTANIISGTPDLYRPGKDSFESITSVAFGAKAYVFSMALVTAMCFFGAVGYTVLLRDMMEPINDMIIQGSAGGDQDDDSSWWHKNLTMFVVVFIVTPACTLSSFTALRNCGAASMCSILILGSCIVYRSIQCNVNAEHAWYTYVTFLPESPKDILDAAPLFISCFVCHYNILPVHNELQQPTPQRVSWWLRSTTWFAAILYMIIAFAGSAFGHCTATGQVQGNVLLDFDENDPLLMVGRMCLAMTITLAFPLLVIPARDILLRSLIIPCLVKKNQGTNSDVSSNVEVSAADQLQEPLLGDDGLNTTMETNVATATTAPLQASFLLRLITAIAILWTSAAVASCVESIDIVWDLLGSSLSILLSYLIPSGCYLAVTQNNPATIGHLPRSASRFLAWCLILFFTPLMFVSTGNAIANTFFV
jgi:amino acid permease